MSVNENDASFRQAYRVDKPGIVGAKWWQDAVDEQAEGAAVGRRAALLGCVGIVGIGVVGSAVAIVAASSSDDDDIEFRTVDKSSLETQRKHGWNFSAITEPLVFDGAQKTPFDRAAFTMLKSDLLPVRAELRPYFWPTLFDASSALPTAPIPGESPDKPLLEVLKPIATPGMESAYRRGKALASIFEGATNDTAVIVDLAGPESVAWAAGMAHLFEPVCTFDNWPHPRGVVPAHLTLAAAAYYQPLFNRMKQRRPASAAPVFVLDRKRLAPYADETRQFDNRYVAKLPPAKGLTALGVRRVLYVVPGAPETTELDDLNDDFVAYKAAGIDVKMVAATDFQPRTAPVKPDEKARLEQAGEWPPYDYGATPASADGFFVDYGWQAAHPAKAKLAVAPGRRPSPHRTWSPAPRATTFGASQASAASADGVAATNKPSKTPLGTVPVAIAVATGVILGTRYGIGRLTGPRNAGRTGSWGRSSGSGWG